MLSKGWTMGARLLIACATILLTLSGCGTSTGADSRIDPFCVVVGPPPPELIPEPGAPHGWIDNYLAVYDEVC